MAKDTSIKAQLRKDNRIAEAVAHAKGVTVEELYFGVTQGPATADEFDPAHLAARLKWKRFLARAEGALRETALEEPADQD